MQGASKVVGTVRTPAPSGDVVRNGGSRNSRSHSVVAARRVRAEGTLRRGRENPFKPLGEGGKYHRARGGIDNQVILVG